MKISCQSCQAKYTIADEKVLGKIVKIRCKKCSSTIVINGNDTGAAAGGDQVYDYTAQGSAEQWTVNLADGDQRNMTTAEIADAYRAGVANDETYCWKDGMADWLPIREIEPLYSACTTRSPSLAPAMNEPEPDDQVTRIQESNLGSMYGGAQPAPQPMAQPAFPQTNGPYANGGPFAPQAAAPQTAARRPNARAGADLFGTAQAAGSDDEVMTSAPAGMPQPHVVDPSGKMTGQRNENSVLFSLSALTGGPPGGAPAAAAARHDSGIPLAQGEGSGLIDIRALAQNIAHKQPEPQRSNRVDDIMNLGGGGAFMPALNAPILSAPAAAPVLDAPDLAAPGMSMGAGDDPSAKQKKMLMMAIVGGCGLAAVAIVVVVIVMVSGGGSTGAAASASATSSAKPTTTATSTAAKTATATATASAAPAPTESASAAPAASAADPEDPSAPEFSVDDVKPALKSAAKAAATCAKPGGPTGKGRVLLIYKHDGTPGSVTFKEGSFEGTPVGDCVLSKFKLAKVPKFKGEAPPLEKSFTVGDE